MVDPLENRMVNINILIDLINILMYKSIQINILIYTIIELHTSSELNVF